MTYQPPVRDHAFILRDVLNIDQHGDLPGFSDAPFDVVEQILDAAAQFTGEVLAPLNTVGDKNGCKLDPATNVVTTPPASRTPTSSCAKAAGPAWAQIPPMAARASRTSST
ncbi:acyl-CoA dehydrogenase N-terminal domain-containing protein [Caulobacter segnis]